MSPAPPPGGRVPSWVNVVPPARPAGQLPAVNLDDLTALVVRRAFERILDGEVEVTIRDAAALLKVVHDQAVLARDAAFAELEEAQHAMMVLRSAIIRRSGQDEWRELAAEVLKERDRARERQRAREALRAFARSALAAAGSHPR